MKHTKGNWKVFNRNEVKSETENTKVAWASSEANARLIAAAPELLETLQNVRKYLDYEFQTKDEIIPDWIVQAYEDIDLVLNKINN